VKNRTLAVSCRLQINADMYFIRYLRIVFNICFWSNDA